MALYGCFSIALQTILDGQAVFLAVFFLAVLAFLGMMTPVVIYLSDDIISHYRQCLSKTLFFYSENDT